MSTALEPPAAALARPEGRPFPPAVPDTDPARGLSGEEARARLAAHGPNALEEAPPPSALRRFVRQFEGLVIQVLLAAAVLSGFLGDWLEAGAILAIVVLNAIVGFVQESRAGAALDALRRMMTPRARVVRDGRSVVIGAEAVVVGDVLLVEAGDLVAADARLVEASSLEANEALLTGESFPVPKPADGRLLAGTTVTRGQGRALVTAIGMATELGRIARLLETAGQDPTPLQQRLDAVSRRLLALCGAIVGVVFLLGLARGEPVLDMLLAALSLAVAAIPEGMPAVVTLALAVGVQRMARRRALVRRLPAVETLGSAQIICSDKTGTLTAGRLAVRALWTPAGGVRPADGRDTAVRRLFHAAAACSEAELYGEAEGAAVVGDPTEVALLVAAAQAGIERPAIELAEPRVLVVPFDSDRRRMTVARRTAGGLHAYVKGAPDVLLPRCARAAADGADVPLDDLTRGRARAAIDAFAAQALRVLAVAERRVGEDGAPLGAEDLERDLTLLGLVALADPPRPEAAEAVRRCRAAGIRVVMITGDHPATGAAVAREIGILEGDRAGAVLAGDDLDRLDQAGLARAVQTAVVFARVTPEHKLRIVRACKRAGLVVAMTGDGVNDAPAVREASVGVAMGRGGTEVTRQAADIVITDDNFATIVNAVEEGRRIFDNIQKTLLYLLAGNTGEILVMLLAALAGWPIPLLPVHILWVNFVTDGPPALALATERVDPDALTRPPRPLGASFADRTFLRRLALVGSLVAVVSLLGFWLGYREGGDVTRGRSLAFAVLITSHVLWALAARSWRRPAWRLGYLTNRRLLGVVAATLALQVALQSWPAATRLFGTAPLSAADWLLSGALGALPALVVEVSKLVLPQPPGERRVG